MATPEDLTYNGFLDLRHAVAQIIAGEPRFGTLPEVEAEHLRAAEKLIAADVLQIDKILPSVQS